jgi:Type II secretion system (T2SS), protein N
MPTSPSPRRGASGHTPALPYAPARPLWYAILAMFVLAALAVAVSVLPASLVARFLPAAVHAEDFSGSIWHGSAGRITVNARDAGSIEWRLHPLELLRLRVEAELRWVRGGIMLDGAAGLDRSGLIASDIQGGGPIEDLRGLGLAAGWRGTAQVHVKELRAVFSGAAITVQAAVGDIAVSDLSSPQVAEGANLGGYSLHFADPAMTPDSEATAQITDTGGPLSVDALIRFSAKQRSAMLSGTLKERAGAPAALRSQLEDLARLHARDAQGRIPVDLEFTF